jgi:nicotinate-nucleotide adenylyltransferase
MHGACAPYEDRVRMVELATAGDPRLCVSRLEEGTARSYSIDTIEKARATLAPEDELYFLIGADAFAEIETWRRWHDVAAAVRFIVVSRPNAAYAAPAEARVQRLATLNLDVSSSAIRRAIARGERPASLPPQVLGYIETHRLYR